MYLLAFFCGGMLIGYLLSLALTLPAVRRAAPKILAIMLIGICVGFLIWASLSPNREDRMRAPFGSGSLPEVLEALAWVVGLILGRISALALLTIWRRRANKD